MPPVGYGKSSQRPKSTLSTNGSAIDTPSTVGTGIIYSGQSEHGSKLDAAWDSLAAKAFSGAKDSSAKKVTITHNSSRKESADSPEEYYQSPSRKVKSALSASSKKKKSSSSRKGAFKYPALDAGLESLHSPFGGMPHSPLEGRHQTENGKHQINPFSGEFDGEDEDDSSDDEDSEEDEIDEQQIIRNQIKSSKANAKIMRTHVKNAKWAREVNHMQDDASEGGTNFVWSAAKKLPTAPGTKNKSSREGGHQSEANTGTPATGRSALGNAPLTPPAAGSSSAAPATSSGPKKGAQAQHKARRMKRKLKKMLSLFKDELPVDRLAVEELKETGNHLYLERDYEGAVDFFTKAIMVFEARFYENCPRDYHSKKVLSILYGNRCQCYLMLAKNAQGGEFFDPREVGPEVRYWALRANRDAVMSYTLDPLNAKSFHRRGQALLLLSSLQQRSKAAVHSFERALKFGTLPEATKSEALQWLNYAQQRMDDETPLPVFNDAGDGKGCAMQ